MSFTRELRDKYEITAAAEWQVYLAEILLADAFAGAVESAEESELSEEEKEHLEGVRKDMHGDIHDKLLDLVDDAGLDIDDYLDLTLVDKMSQEVQRTLGVTLQDIYEVDEEIDGVAVEGKQWAVRAALNLVGHGISPFDDNEFQKWLQYKSGRVAQDWRRHRLFESPHAKALDLLAAVLEKQS